LTSVALRVAFSAALAGHCDARPDLVMRPIHWETTIPALACDAGADLISRIFVPLGYEANIERLPLDPRFPDWGEANLYRVRLTGEQTTQALLSHLYVLLPVLDNAKHYRVDAQEAAKLLAHGASWLVSHPERDLITRRYLRYKHPLIRQFEASLARLAEDAEEVVPSAAMNGATDVSDLSNVGQVVATLENPVVTPADDAIGASAPEGSPELRLHDLRLQAVMDAVGEIGARSLVDLGCGEGRLLELALKERSLTRILGVDVSSVALARVRRRLHYETLPDAQQRRLQIALGSLLYRDKRLEGFDAAALVEVIEHLDAPRLGAMERVVFGLAHPRRVIVTTPNQEYNIHWQQTDQENPADHSSQEARLRHSDHRFEWTRAEGHAWAARVAGEYGYRFTQRELGPDDPDRPEIGAPSQMLVFDLA
ncbi:MAG TPA: methyltransferase, partial [Ktedonobacterales bacterium]|nr:methyltransferase [Ktedonobacterales bacterium]